MLPNMPHSIRSRMKTNDKQLDEISKFLSYVLRHEPSAIGLQLDAEGWANIDSLIAGAATQSRILDRATIRIVVEKNDKKRFAISDDSQSIRAVQGHSTSAVQRKYVAQEPPEFLYHGTATRFLQSILVQGLKPGSRHHVHLSRDIATATAVGQRHGKAVVLQVQALKMYQQSLQFYLAENGVWLTDTVPTEFLCEI